MADEITIGRNVPESKSSFIVPNQYKGVSGTHAKVSRGGDGRLYIEDLDSTNGTYVNNLKIKRSPITKSDKITLGGKIGVGYPLQLQSIIELLPISDDEFNHRMNQLKHVWDNHQEFQNEIKLRQQKIGTYKMLPIVLAGVIGAAVFSTMSQLGIIEADSAMNGILNGVISLAFTLTAYIIGDKIVASKSSEINQEAALEVEQFQLKYECPACNRFLGNTAWAVIAAKKECPCCKKTFTPQQ
ncbi:MAG: FHA domain-containing protein [Muribaculaceae bacterium]|nr:FHA domain-containing protein [Muribaculaceae bacterium]